MPCVQLNVVGYLTFAGIYKPGDPAPAGYLDWHEWAAVQHKARLKQVSCGQCGLWKYPQELSDKVIVSLPMTAKGIRVKRSSQVCLKCVQQIRDQRSEGATVLAAIKIEEFFVQAIPVAQPRQRHAFRNGMVRNYIPSDHPIHAFKQIIRFVAAPRFSGHPLEAAVLLTLEFLLPRPKSMVWKKKDMPRCLAPGKPDLDNYCKAVMDALNGVAWVDDGQVVKLTASKLYAAGKEEPGVTIKIIEV